MEEFNPEKHYLGKLCKRGHEYRGTGKSLRYRSGDSGCRECALERAEKWRTQNKLKYRGYLKKYYRKNWQALEKQKKRYIDENKEEVTARKNAADKRRARDLDDLYIKKLLNTRFGLLVNQITPELIELKREQIRLYREKQRLRKEEEQWRKSQTK